MYEVELHENLAFSPERKLALDLYLPVGCRRPPVVLYLHGGGFQVGDKSDNAQRVRRVSEFGIAVAAVNYSLAPAVFPTPLIDVKEAIRWLRIEGSGLGVSTDRIGVWGASAGGYLAIMAGLTGDDDNFQNQQGGAPDSVQAVVTWFAPSDLVANSSRSPLETIVGSPPVEHALLGRSDLHPRDADLARASPLGHVHPKAPPFLVVTGDRDKIVAESQGRYLHDALVRVGAESTFSLIGGAGHEDPKFDSPAHLALTAAWLLSHLHEAQ